VVLKAAKRSWKRFGRPFRATKYAPQVSTWLFSRQSLEEKFCELRLYGVLESLPGKVSNIIHWGMRLVPGACYRGGVV
jgi:hypothetical protein